MMEGVEITDNELLRFMTYFQCAYNFGWTIEETDKVEARTLDALMEILPKWCQKMGVKNG